MRATRPIALALSVAALAAGALVAAQAAPPSAVPAGPAAEPAQVQLGKDRYGPSRLGANGRNVVFVLTDDMRVDDLRYMPSVRRLIGRRGVSFTNAYAVDPVCCPSRVSILTGQYGHSSGVLGNFFPRGGFAAFHDDESIATWLDERGYTTGYFGKYLNQYGKTARRYVPPGWDTWQAAVRGVYAYRDPTVYNIDGQLETKPPYQADTLTRMATSFITGNTDRKMFVHVAYSTPHQAVEGTALGQPPVPALRHEHSYDGMQAPVGDPAYDEDDVSDKAKVIRRRHLTARQHTRIRFFTEVRRESLLAVDEGVAEIVATLKRERLLDRTTIVFASDNGFFLGEHRYPGGKHLPYEPVAQVPLLMRGPGIPQGVTRPHVVGLHDLAPTFLGLTGSTGAQGRFPIDGTNLLPFVRDRGGAATGRDLLIESLARETRWRSYDAIRTTSGYKYVEYAARGVELYDLGADPSETENLARRPRYGDLRDRLARRLDAVRSCGGAQCR